MERYSSGNKRRTAPATAQQAAGAAQETFSEMANVTANKSGWIGKLLVLSLILVSIAVTAFVGYAILKGADGVVNNGIEKDQYQAVFLTDGQIYFGKLEENNSAYATLSDIYYLQVKQQVQPVQGDNSADPEAKITLAKLGNELHGPEDKMHINRDQILFWENLKNDGKVVDAITRFVNGDSSALDQTSAPASGDQN